MISWAQSIVDSKPVSCFSKHKEAGTQYTFDFNAGAIYSPSDPKNHYSISLKVDDGKYVNEYYKQRY